MKSFQQFITEAELKDKEGLGHGTGMTHRGGEKIGSDRKKTEPEKRRTKVVDGKRVPTQYKPRKDIGTQKPRSEREQQPQKDRGSAALSVKAAQKKAYLERKARQAGAKTPTRTQLLTKKTTKTDPKYKPQKASGDTAAERKAITRKGERKLRDLTLAATGKTKESELKHPITSKEITRRNRKK